MEERLGGPVGRWSTWGQRMEEMADRAAAGIGLTLWDYKAEQGRRAEGHLGGAVMKTFYLSFLSVEGLVLHTFDLHR